VLSPNPSWIWVQQLATTAVYTGVAQGKHEESNAAGRFIATADGKCIWVSLTNSPVFTIIKKALLVVL